MPLRRRSAWHLLGVLRSAIVIISLVIFVGPIIWFGVQALQPRVATGTYAAWIWRFDLTNIAHLFGNGAPGDYTSAIALGFPRALTNSIVIALLTAVCTVTLALPAGYVIGLQRPLSWRSIIGLFGTVGLPPVVVVVPVLALIRTIGLHDTYAGLVIVHVAIALPFAIAVIAAQDIPRVAMQNEVAALDGIPVMTRVYRLTLGALKPAVVAAGLVAFVLSYTEFFFALILTASEVRTAPVVAAGFQTLRGVQWGLVAAAAMVLMMPCLGVLIALACVRRVRSALGVKM